MNSTAPLRIGLLGYGRMGHIHGQILSEFPGVRVTRIFDPEAAPGTDPRLAATPDEVLADADVDAVYISVPNAFTSAYAVDSLRAGKHVFCEKPLGRSSQEAEAIARAAAERPGQVFKVGFNHRYLDHYLEAKARIATGEFGRILWIRGRYGKGSSPEYGESWRAVKALSGGGILLDQGIHMLDLIMDLVGEDFVEVKSMALAQRWDHLDCEDNAFILLRTAADQLVCMHSSLTQYKHLFSMEIGLETGLIEVTGVLSSTKSYGPESLRVSYDWKNNKCREEVMEFSSADYYSIRAETADFLDCVRAGRQPTVGTIHEGVRVLRLVEQVYASAGLTSCGVK